MSEKLIVHYEPAAARPLDIVKMYTLSHIPTKHIKIIPIKRLSETKKVLINMVFVTLIPRLLTEEYGIYDTFFAMEINGSKVLYVTADGEELTSHQQNATMEVGKFLEKYKSYMDYCFDFSFLTKGI